MSNPSLKIGRWIAAVLALLLLGAVFYNVVKDNMPPAEARKIESYTAWDPKTIEIAESIPLQDGGRIKPFSTYAAFSMLSLHGARSMEVQDEKGVKTKIKPTAWMLDTLFRPQFAVKLPTFRIDNSSIIEAVGLKTGDKRDRYSYDDIEPGREKLIELAKKYEMIAEDKRDTVHKQTIAFAYQIRNYESLLGYFGFARYGVVLKGSGKDGAPDQRADISAIMATAPQIRQQLAQSQAHAQQMEPHLQALLEQVFDAANFAKYGMMIVPPADPKVEIWQSAGNSIMSAITETKADPKVAIADIKLLETTVRSLATDEASFRVKLTELRDDLAKRATARGEYEHVKLEAAYYQKNWFLYSMAFFILGTLLALAMWTVSNGLAGKIFYWLTLGITTTGLIYCIIPIVKRCIIMQRPPVGNLYDTIIFIAATTVIIALVIEWMTRRRFALGIAPILGTLLIIVARRYEVGDAKDNMDPLIAVLDSNYWLTIHVLTITLGYAAGLLSAFLSVCYVLMRGLDLDNGDRDIRRSFTRAVYGMICLTLFLSLVGTVLGGIWANDSWGRFWGWDPKENGALMIVLWTLAILHARLGGYIRDWGLHFASVFTGAVVAFSWWHVNFLNTGLHTYGFTADKKVMIFVFYGIIAAILVFGVIAKALESQNKLEKH